MNTKQKVSIIIPVYNGSRYMKEAIDSALNQTYNNIEIIIVNDGSADGGKTRNIAKSYGEKIKYFEKENGGVSTALNLALKEMTGDYFSWLSHDDVYYPFKIEKEIKYLEENNLYNEKVILYSDYELIDLNSKHINDCIKNHEEICQKPEYGLLRGHINGLTLLIPKSAFDEYGNFDEGLRAAQDYALWHKMFETYKPLHIPEVLVKSRFHAAQVSNTSPRVEKEGNDLWIQMIEAVSNERKMELEGSIYNYYFEMCKFLKGTPYKVAENFCHEKCNNIIEKAKKEVPSKKISVIIPTFNREQSTLNAIKSVFSQTHKNFEIIIIDDGSTIQQPKLEKVIKENKIIFVKTKTNGGPAAARNLGITKATGEYIAFLDSDDLFEPKKLEKQLLYMIASKSKVSHTSYTSVIGKNKNIINSGLDNGFVAKKLMYSCQIATPTVMIETKYIIEGKFSFNSNIRIGEDTCLWLTMLKHEYLLGIDEPLSVVNSNKNSAAFDCKQQMSGLKNILIFLLNDEYYSNFDKELSRMAASYAYYTRLVYPESEVALETEEGRLERWSRLLIHYIKTEGIRKTIIRTKNKIIRKIKGDK